MPRTVASDVYKRLCSERKWNNRLQMKLIGLSSSAVNTLTVHGAATTTYATFHKVEEAMKIPYGFFELILEGDVDELRQFPVGDTEAGVSQPILDMAVRKLSVLTAVPKSPGNRKKA